MLKVREWFGIESINVAWFFLIWKNLAVKM